MSGERANRQQRRQVAKALRASQYKRAPQRRKPKRRKR